VWNTDDGALVTAFIASPGQTNSLGGAR
jgi:hypothetical protein